MNSNPFMKVMALITFGATILYAQTGRADRRSERHDTDDVKTISGTVTKVEHPVATLNADDGKEYSIHMGPSWFWEKKDYSLKSNTKATVKGETETIKGKHHLYPWEIVQDGTTLRLADDEGVPAWARNRGGRGYGRGVGYGGGRGRGNWGRGCCPCR